MRRTSNAERFLERTNVIRIAVTPELNAVSSILMVLTLVVSLTAFRVPRCVEGPAMSWRAWLQKCRQAAGPWLSLLPGLMPAVRMGPAAGATELNVFTWNNSLPATIARFESECGCRVKLTYFGAMEEALAKLAGGARGFDVVGPCNYGIPPLIRLGLLQPLDKHAIPNAHNLDPAFLDTPLDPGNTYSLPYDFTVTLIGYNTTRLRELGLDPSSWALVFDPHQLAKIRGKVTVLDDPREVIAAALRYKGYSANSNDPAQLRDAAAVIRAAMPYWADQFHVARRECRGDYQCNRRRQSKCCRSSFHPPGTAIQSGDQARGRGAEAT